jgi:hypothetical protein
MPKHVMVAGTQPAEKSVVLTENKMTIVYINAVYFNFPLAIPLK